ncbi:hypothetical protein ASZ78_000642 [Callipepla squamata]|uniref:Uncharacterized protein n=1 Tax=Callipepla squamata TaxID=9009 RepID=A0A226NFL1_CALSU|nr:hypothetical protein ASZ78_000642 [Callipepla squamata]
MVSFEVTKTVGSKSNRSYQVQSSGKRTESLQNTERLQLSFLPCSDSFGQGDKRSTHQAAKDVHQNDSAIQTQKNSENGRADCQLPSPQDPSTDKNSQRLCLKNADENTWEITTDEWVFPESFTEDIQLEGSEQHAATRDSVCCDLISPETASIEHQHNEMGDHDMNHKEIFTFSSRPRSAPHGKSPSTSPGHCIFPLDLEQDSNHDQEETQNEDNFQGTDSSEEDDNSDFIQSAKSLEISCSRQGTCDSAVLKDNTLKTISWREEYWKNPLGHSKQNLKETTVPKPQSSTIRKTEPVSNQRTLKPTLSLSPTGSKTEFFEVIPNASEKDEKSEGVSSQIKSSVSKNSLKKISRESARLPTQAGEYDWKSYQSSRLSASELQMLASMKRQQNEELKDIGISHGLSASQIDNCNVSISTSSDDTTTWNSHLPPPVSQQHHYQKEMSPLSRSNPR